MKLFAAASLAVISAVSADKEAYGKAAVHPYGPEPSAPVYYGTKGYDPYAGGEQPAPGYGYSPYAPHTDTYAKYEYADFVEPVYPQKSKPNPFIDYPKEGDLHDDLRIPHLGNYHCFLTGAPWTKCGRRSLTSYFLDQCMVFYYAMSTNVDGICGSKKEEKAVIEKDYYGAHSVYGSPKAYAPPAYHPHAYHQPPPKYNPPTPAPTPAPTSAAPKGGYGGASLGDYQKERCLQNAYLSINTALVLCLTENMVRIKYIEHYAKSAARNPIEGPILYLRKLHTFITSVLSCTGNSAVNSFPNLWNDFRNSDGALMYSPNMPYEVDSDGTVGLDQYMSSESTGFNDITVDNYLLCNNVNDLVGGTYATDAGNKHYSTAVLKSCTTSNAKVNLGYDRIVKKCGYIDQSSADSGSPKGPKEQYYSDTTLEGLYESVNPVSRSVTAAFRVRSIAEIAVADEGVVGQPLLEGFGIMYFCAFYACKANNGGDLEGTCFPAFDCENDWTVPANVGGFDTFNEYGDKVEYCLKNKHLTKEDVARNSKVRAFKALLRRSYICMAENTVVDFYNQILTVGDYGDAWAQVYMRHLGVEKCYEDDAELCTPNATLYQALLDALKDLETQCSSRRDAYYAPKKYVPRYPIQHAPYPVGAAPRPQARYA